MEAQGFEALLNREERALLATFTTPAGIQAFLDGIAYSTEPIYRCPLRVLRERTGHCFDGALFAAAMLRRLGQRPLIVDMLPNERDDDHVLAVYRVDGYWGAVAKSNFAGLRYREPVYRSLRELIMSYFEVYFNVNGEKTLRGYTTPLDLSAFDARDWLASDEPLEAIADRLGEIRHFSLLTPAMVARLAPVDVRSYQAGLQGSNPAGLFKLE
ncbi:MAG TPA: hypothetical protein PLJ35_08980 [Anaerolineae bacterium]|nr:hypothetical protein [Anaerolineae bacterium]HOQ98942.1 hypothetical protein [Anaerolineae bacterium]HPL26538.1 hypothetical protein [Anaerolineae bacterium]